MGYRFFVAKKYIGAGRRSAFITAITVISVAGVAIGVLALIVILAVMNGFESEVLDRIIGTNAHLIVRKEPALDDFEDVASQVSGLPGIVAVAPFVLSKAMVISRDATDAVVVKGIDLDSESGVTDVSTYILPPGFRFDDDETAVGRIVIGKELAYSLRVSIGDTLLLARGDISEISPYGITPTFERFRVGGYFDSGMYDFDASLAFMSLSRAQTFYGLGEAVTGLSARVDDMYRAPYVGQAVAAALGSSFQVDQDTYSVEISTTGKRSQVVNISVRESGIDGQMILLYTPVGSVGEGIDWRSLLELNVGTIYARVGIIGEQIVIVAGQMLDRVDVGEAMSMLSEVGTLGDVLESLFFGENKF